MKKLLALLMTMLMMVCLAACGGGGDDQSETPQTDLEYVKEKGTLVVGITDYAPMDYKDADGNWIGFDADMATAFAESLGVEVVFQEIDWDSKIMELDGKTIDCVWNGMTLTDEVKAAMSTSNPYCSNTQMVIVPVDQADDFGTIDQLAGHTFAVESGSAGEDEAEGLNLTTVPVKDQATALMEVAAGTSEAAVVDSLMAGAMVGEGTNYADLTFTIGLNSEEGEEFGVGFRKDSDLTAALNTFFQEAYADGSMMECAEIYGVQAAILPQ